MFARFASIATVALSLLAQIREAHGHAVFLPALGVGDRVERNDVKRPSGGRPCGIDNGDIAEAIPRSSFANLANGNLVQLKAKPFNG
jgi:hypothetical protein